MNAHEGLTREEYFHMLKSYDMILFIGAAKCWELRRATDEFRPSVRDSIDCCTIVTI